MDTTTASALAGFFASASTIIFFPLEMARIRMMVSDGHSRNFVPYFHTSYQALETLYKEKGFFALYKGSQVSLISNIAWMAYFYFYESAKGRYSHEFMHDHPESYKFLVAAEAAVLARLATNPLWVVKTRIMLQKYHRNWRSDLIEAVRKIYKVDGISGYWSGLGAGLILASNGAVQVYTYQTLKEYLGTDSTWKVSLAGGLSKLVSGILLYPVQTIMTRLQQEQYSHYIEKHSLEVDGPIKGEPLFRGMSGCIRKTMINEGVSGFYRGIFVHLTRLVPANALFFVVYEGVLKLCTRSKS